MPPSRASIRTLALIASAVTAASLLPALPAAAAAHRVGVPAPQPAWASAKADRGAAPGDQTIEVQVALDLQDEAGAEAFATAVSTPGSGQYGQALSPADWIARYAPTQQQVDDLTAAGAQAGLTVEAVPDSRLFVLFTGSVDAIDAFFATQVHAYSVDGSERFAALGGASLPARLGRSVSAVAFDHARIAQRSMVPAAASARKTACSHYWKQHTITIPKAFGATRAATPTCGATAAQIRGLAGLDAAGDLDGSGQTVVVIDAFGSTTMADDLHRYSAANGLPDAEYEEHVPDRATWDTGSGCSPAGWAVEQSLDLEAVHATAPKAKLVYVGTKDCGYGFDLAVSQVLDQGLGSIVSNSWGATGLDLLAAGPLSDDPGTIAEIAVNLHQHVQAAGQGVGLYFASGDAGDDAAVLGVTAVDFPASSPWVTAVGGTSSAVAKDGSFLFSAPWGTNLSVAKKGKWTPKAPGLFTGGSGGGLSALFARPAYQQQAVTLGGTARALPDVSALAAPETGMRIGFTEDGAYRTATVGGTSLATPITAGQVALAQQHAGRALGFLNPALYALAAAGKVRDVAPSATRRFVASTAKGRTVLITLDRDSSLKARKGWDEATGVGELTLDSILSLGG